jgi:S-formylglutathione hydrolase FrmB
VRAALALAAGLSLAFALTPASGATSVGTVSVGKIGACPASRCHTYRVPVPRGVHITDNRIEVILPVGYATSHRRYPVIYLFNGAWGPYNEWIEHTDIGTYARNFPAIFVDFDGGDKGVTGYWSDWLDGTYQWETWHTKTLFPWVDAHFRTTGVRGAIGVSLGSTGALSYAERHPGLFRSIATFSGLVDTQFLTPVSGYDAVQQDPGVTRAWGDQTLNANVWAQHNPTVSAAKLAGTHVYIACGTGATDPTDTSIHGGQQEQYLFEDQPTFVTALDLAGVQHTDNFYQGGEHNWPYFIPDLRWALPQMIQDLHA